MSGVEIRCDCKGNTLLAVARRDLESKDPYVHIKAHKQKKVIAEVVVEQGVIRLHCRSCGRWHRITVTPERLAKKVEALPSSIVL